MKRMNRFFYLLLCGALCLFSCDGDIGPQGEKGDTGDQGEKGETGDAGQDGEDGVSERYILGSFQGTFAGTNQDESVLEETFNYVYAENTSLMIDASSGDDLVWMNRYQYLNSNLEGGYLWVEFILEESTGGNFKASVETLYFYHSESNVFVSSQAPSAQIVVTSFVQDETTGYISGHITFEVDGTDASYYNSTLHPFSMEIDFESGCPMYRVTEL